MKSIPHILHRTNKRHRLHQQSRDPQCLSANNIVRKIKILARSRYHIKDNECQKHAIHIHMLRSGIMHIAEQKPLQAIALLKRLITAHRTIMHRTKDNYRHIERAFRRCVEDLGTLYAQQSEHIAREEVIHDVWQRFHDNAFEVHQYIINDFKEALGDEGLHMMAKKLQAIPSETVDNVPTDKTYFKAFCLQAIDSIHKDSGYF